MKTENDKIAQELFEKGYKLFHEEHDYKGAEKGRARRIIKILINEDCFIEMKIVILQLVN